MSEYRPKDLQLSATGLRFVIVAARFNSDIVTRLVQGAIDTLVERGGSTPEVVTGPGAYELPLLAQAAIARGDVDAVIALGAVIRGDTPHFDFVAGECAAGLMRVQLDTGVPVAFGVITTDDLAQAEARCGGSACNKGAEAALAALETVHALHGHRG